MGTLAFLMALMGCSPDGDRGIKLTPPGDTAQVDAGTSQEETLPVQPTTWNDGIGEIFQENCVRCHSLDQVSTYRPLTTYENVVAERFSVYTKIRESTTTTQMPPAPNGETETCQPTHSWQNDLRMTDDQIESILAWIEDGSPRGTGTGPAEPLALPPTPQLEGATDHPFVEGYTVSIDSSLNMKDDFVCVIIDPTAAGATRADGTASLSGLQPGIDDAHLFKGMQVRLDASGDSLAMVSPGSGRLHGSDWYECADGFGFDGQLVTAFMPESGPFETPAGTSIDLPVGARIVYRTHYHSHYDNLDPLDTTPLPPVLEWEDHTSLLIRWEHGETEPVTLVTVGATDAPIANGEGLATAPFEVPAKSRGHVEIMSAKVPGTSRQKYAVAFAHNQMGDAGATAELRLDGPNSPPTAIGGECLVANPNWAATWQLPVTYDVATGTHPLAQGGDSLLLQCSYDNSGETPLLLGNTSSDEICEAVVGLVAVP